MVISLELMCEPPLIAVAVALFMNGGSSLKKSSTPGRASDNTLMGALMLSISLCFDGATGAYEDKLMSNDHVRTAPHPLR